MKKTISFLFIMLLHTIYLNAQDNWNNQNPPASPPSMENYTNVMAFAGDDKVVLFGGFVMNINLFDRTDNTWVYDLGDNTWTLKSPSIRPFPRDKHAIAYIGDDKVLIFGGYSDLGGGTMADTWVYDLSEDTWTEKNPTANPGPNSGNCVMTWIGEDKALLVSSGGITWVYDLSDNTWTQKNPPNSPAGRGSTAIASIGGDKVLLFGGDGYDDSWIYDLSDNNWTFKNSSIKPAARGFHKMAWLGGDRVLMFGGFDFNSTNVYNDTWIYDLSDDMWTLKNPATSPSASFYHTMAPIGNNKVLLLFPEELNHKTWLFTATQTCNMTVSAGTDENLYFGYAPGQCKTKTVTITDGTGPYTYNWTLSRTLLPGETMTGSTTASVTVCLMDTAELCVTVTDANNCTATDCVMMFAEDVRCGNNQNQKVNICHYGHTICVDANAVPAHQNHGDYIGPCNAVNRPVLIHENIDTGLNVFPNPGNGEFTLTINLSGADNTNGTIRILNTNGQLVKTMSVTNQSRVHVDIDRPGVYIAQVVMGKQIINKKIVVIR